MYSHLIYSLGWHIHGLLLIQLSGEGEKKCMVFGVPTEIRLQDYNKWYLVWDTLESPQRKAKVIAM